MTVVRVMRTMWASTVNMSTATGSTSMRAMAPTSEARPQVGDGRQPAQMHREHRHQYGGDEEVGNRDQGERDARYDPVHRTVGLQRAHQPESRRRAAPPAPPSPPPAARCSGCARRRCRRYPRRLRVTCRSRRPAGSPARRRSAGVRAHPGRARSRTLATSSGVAPCPRMARATSPGRISVPTKTRTETNSRMRTPSASRRAIRSVSGTSDRPPALPAPCSRKQRHESQLSIQTVRAN